MNSISTSRWDAGGTEHAGGSVFIEEDNFDRARKKIKENRNAKIVFSSNDDEISRKVIEKEPVSILLIKQKGRKDRQKQRNSGLNSVMSKIAKKRGIEIGIFLDEITESHGKDKAEILSRVEQNIKLCKKEKLKMKFISHGGNNGNDYDLKALALILGMPTWAIKDL
jgi:RNase P/RNase MRP subunit p30